MKETKINVVSIKVKESTVLEEYLKVCTKYFKARVKHLENVQKSNKLQMDFSMKKEVVEVTHAVQTLQAEANTIAYELNELELKGAGIEIPTTPPETKTVAKKEKKDE